MQIKKPQHLQALRELLAGTRYLLCVDLEATCDEYPTGLTDELKPEHKLAVSRHEMETIEVGAVVLDLHRDCKIVSEYTSFVRPVLNPILTDFCKRLTTIDQADVDGADSYDKVRQKLEDYLSPFKTEGLIWCSWGDYDAKQLAMDAVRNRCEPMLADLSHTNAKKWHWKILSCRALALRPAVEGWGIEWSGQYHRGIDDARNLGALMGEILRAQGKIPESSRPAQERL
ncbi:MULTISPECIES: 3'-5' exonuclease [Pseudomonas]|uniref:3'-5' exonuclease n=1 Tax=Pseudomonas TaxID=286 RepID=UPI000CE5EF56|nr:MULTISPECIES: 3'-5' exonuclease [Pseudomonas]AVD91473.1 exonuclease [Pseudomonas sp. SWI36]MDD2040112.1 exonuclease domain-containing protein [Pseudomonas putida]MDD2045558.1 exonuclease domain-containing protein [Pseudomonas putida]MDH1551713.1 exonuclease domain-containing protein [Pseudomonas juntendi]